MFYYFYNITWTLGMAICLPVAFLFFRKTRFFARLRPKLSTNRLKQGSLWVHALSVGEVISAIPLINVLAQRFPQKEIVFTVTTEKGMQIAQKELGNRVAALLFFPLDFWWSVHRIVNHIKPAVFVLVETDIWPGLLGHLQKKRISSILVNGRLSPRTFRSYSRFRYFAAGMYAPVTRCLMQSELDKKRILQLGISPAKVITTGNIKFDREWTPMTSAERSKLQNELNLAIEGLLWVAGSTHENEERILLTVHQRLLGSHPGLRLIIAPRKIERAPELLRLARNKGLKASLKTETHRTKDPYDVLILDTLGELGRIYGLARVSFVGGSLAPFGGHNLLEPASFGCPVLFGPYTHNFVEMSELLEQANGGQCIKTEEDLFLILNKLLADSALRATMGKNAADFVTSNTGALERVVSCIVRAMEK
jgi:3-deoxy-D-manno-octulosonic-acid transferase